MRIEQHLEMTVSESMDKELNELLQHAFSSIYPNRCYFKQLPHLRLIAYEDERIIGQVGLDFRVMNMNGEPSHVLGIIDLCVREEVSGTWGRTGADGRNHCPRKRVLNRLSSVIRRPTRPLRTHRVSHGIQHMHVASNQ